MGEEVVIEALERSVELSLSAPGALELERVAPDAQAIIGPLAPADLEPDCWDQQDLARRLCHALDIGTQAVERLAAKGYTDSVEPGNNVRPEKVIAESALLLLAASDAAEHGNVRARIEKVAQVLIPYARSERMAEAEVALARCLDEQDYDLAGEVLPRIVRSEDFLAWPLSSRSWSAAASFGFPSSGARRGRSGFSCCAKHLP
jgi:hypothetical protein